MDTINVGYARQLGLYGRGVCMAVLDTGVEPIKDLTQPTNRIVGFYDTFEKSEEPYDDNGHGTTVTCVACGNGYSSGQRYIGVAPMSDAVCVKILDKDGQASMGRALQGLRWVMDNYKRFNIRIVNLSIGTDDTGENDPLVRAVEKLWDSGIVVVVAAGNNGPDFGSISAPGNSKKVITVGAPNSFSGRGPTLDCIMKPDCIAPGYVTSCGRNGYIQSLSGTSVSAPQVSGAIALLLEQEKNLTPNQVKYLIKLSSSPQNAQRNSEGWGMLDIKGLLEKAVSNR